MVFAQKTMTQREVDDFKLEFAKIHQITDQDELYAVYSKFEGGMQFLGTAVIEDGLQENVPKVIGRLNQAGIKTWVLTGDKLETACAVAKTCNLDGGTGQEILRI